MNEGRRSVGVAIALSVVAGAVASLVGAAGERAFVVAPRYAAAAYGTETAESTYQWKLPARFPPPRVPADNPMSEAKVELGRHLFYDKLLSGNQTQACASCHEQARAFTDGKRQAVGSTGELHPRGSMSLVNVAYAATLTWANPSVTRLEDQARVPMFGMDPVELGLPSNEDALLGRLRALPRYVELFAHAFPGPDAVSLTHVTQALAAFERTILSGDSPYDRYCNNRDTNAISSSARRGETLFFSQPFSCFRCHGSFTFSGATDFEGRRNELEVEFHNTGLYNLAAALSYPPPNTGVYAVTHKLEDVGKFKAPTLRNIAVTAPYMHDGSIGTLEEVLAHYAAGGRSIADGPYRGVGHDNPNKNPSVRGFPLGSEDRDDLLAFLRSLTDESLLHDSRFSNPWP
jgi:cytochrome c peroxidase